MLHPEVFPGGTIDVSHHHTCAIGSDKHAYCWGFNTRGVLGDGTENTQPRPVQVKGVSNADAVAVSAGFNCALLSDGRLSCWGREPWRKYGAGTEAEVVDTDLRFKQIRAEWGRLCGLTNEKELYCIGRHGLKVEGVERRPWDEGKTWEKISGASNLVQVLFVNLGGCVLSSEGDVSCWEMPGVDATEGATFTRLEGLSGVRLLGYSARGLPCAILDDGSGVCWSDKFYRPGEMLRDRPVDFPLGGVKTMVREFVSGTTDCARYSDDSFGCMGSNRYLGIGAGEPSFRAEPTPVRDFDVEILVEMSGRRLCGKTLSGEVECVDMRESDRPLPPVREMSSGRFSRDCYVDGEDVVCIGRNRGGSLGISPSTDVQEVRHEDLGKIVKLVTASRNACVLLESGQVKCWGSVGGPAFRKRIG